ncbi:hypothetical protein ACJJI5_19980 [Microbulbifer sp. EKSA008]|uniref:hypothetical protein n=1 Tax=unclassified Microbulbifer TaxID=2619833 RepID=UPI0024AD667F|nr:hypothetical protein [Microbulbifer sp. VAAF005]WHI48601.1 hypothetical protein P0078_09610 [Microbulbifer sp. VAAF005]WNZ57202.1 hypothetical protein QT397_07615 [Microbulbifer sp. MKSA007]
MTEDFQFAWMVYAASTLVMLLAGWWFMRNWRWSWVRQTLLLVAAAVLLAPAKTSVAESVAVPVLPLFVYQTLFEENGAAPEVTTNLIFASGGALAIMVVWGIVSLLMRFRRDRRRRFDEDPYFNEQ